MGNIRLALTVLRHILSLILSVVTVNDRSRFCDYRGGQRPRGDGVTNPLLVQVEVTRGSCVRVIRVTGICVHLRLGRARIEKRGYERVSNRVRGIPRIYASFDQQPLQESRKLPAPLSAAPRWRSLKCRTGQKASTSSSLSTSSV
jgi:hypothetical protein